jgi:hypothetical protein
MRVCLIGHGTLHDIDNEAWLPTSPHFWRSVSLIHSDRASRPDIVTDLRVFQLDLPFQQFDMVISMYSGASGMFAAGESTVNFTYFSNVCEMLKPGGVFAMSLSKSLQRGIERVYQDKKKESTRLFCEDIVHKEPRFSSVPPGSYKSAFVTPYVTNFFRSGDRDDIAAKLAGNMMIGYDQILVFKRRATSNTSTTETNKDIASIDGGPRVDRNPSSIQLGLDIHGSNRDAGATNTLGCPST